MRTLVSFCLLTVALPAAAEQAQLDANPALFSVLAAMSAAGYEAGAACGPAVPVRDAVRRHLAGKNLPSVAELRRFYQEHRKKTVGGDFSQFVSFALSTEGPPSFTFRFSPNELPPDVVALDGLQPLLVRFHEEAGLDALWREVQPAWERALASYQEPVTKALFEVNGYLRNPTSGFLGRRFGVYLDLLGPPNQVQTRSYGDDYFLVLTPSADPPYSEVRHGYLHYLLDPLASKYVERWNAKRGVGDYAQGAPHLEESYKNDFLLLATESLIKVIESRLAPGGQSAREALVKQALQEGFVLAPFFAEQLVQYEKQPAAMRLYYPEMVAAINLKQEERRLSNLEFTAAAPVRRAKPLTCVAAEPVPAGAEQSLSEAEELYTKRQLEQSKERYLQVLRETDQQRLHAQAYYGMARIAALQQDWQTAEKLFQRALSLGPEPAVRAWCEVYLGRIAAGVGEREEATKHFRAALAVSGGSEAARKAAAAGLQAAEKTP